MEIVPLADREEFILELAELHHSEWKHLDPLLTIDKRVNAIVNSARRKGVPSIYIAVSENELIGSAALVQNDLEAKPDLHPWLAAVYVKDKFRNRGIATNLIARCELEAAQSGFKIWYLSTEFASGFYKRLGWKYLGQYEYNRVMLSIMSKRIEHY